MSAEKWAHGDGRTKKSKQEPRDRSGWRLIPPHHPGAPGLAGCGRGAVPRALVALKPVWWELGHGWSSVDLLRLSLLTPYLLLGPLTAWGRELGGEKVRTKGDGDTETPVPGEFVLD